MLRGMAHLPESLEGAYSEILFFTLNDGDHPTYACQSISLNDHLIKPAKGVGGAHFWLSHTLYIA